MRNRQHGSRVAGLRGFMRSRHFRSTMAGYWQAARRRRGCYGGGDGQWSLERCQRGRRRLTGPTPGEAFIQS
jgi:hypothetical protein